MSAVGTQPAVPAPPAAVPGDTQRFADRSRPAEGAEPGVPAEDSLHRLEREAHVWYANPDDLAVLEGRYRAILSPAERLRYSRFHFARDRLSYLAAHALLRLTLSRYAALPPKSWRFTTNQHCRPELAPTHTQLGLHFNLSHTEGLVACVVARHPCGIDVESALRSLHPLHLTPAFSAPELAALKASPPEELSESVLAYWTLKEAYAKARGLGLALPFNQVSFTDPVPGAEIRVSFAEGLGDREHDWQFTLMELAPSHLCAVAVRSNAKPVSFVTRRVDLSRPSAPWATVRRRPRTKLLLSSPPRERFDERRRSAEDQ